MSGQWAILKQIAATNTQYREKITDKFEVPPI
jgi:hypothetical protein